MIDTLSHTLFSVGEDLQRRGYGSRIIIEGGPPRLSCARATYCVQSSRSLRITPCVTLGDGGAGLRRQRHIKRRPSRKEPFRPPRVGATRGIPPPVGTLEGYAPELVMPKGGQIVTGPLDDRTPPRGMPRTGADWLNV